MNVGTIAMQAFLVLSMVVLVWFELVGWMKDREERRRQKAELLRLPELQPSILKRVL